LASTLNPLFHIDEIGEREKPLHISDTQTAASCLTISEKSLYFRELA
jgi:hypothetical protein